AQVEDRPGVTKAKQWVKITPYLELMDTPGLLWPKLTDQKYARDLAFLGSINDEIMDIERLACELLTILQKTCPAALTMRYKKLSTDVPEAELLTAVCQSRGFIIRGGEFDSERAARIVLDEFRAGKIARVTLDSVPVVRLKQPVESRPICTKPSDAGLKAERDVTPV
ncbi:MAG: hypothetical protein RR224_11050, partial [Clostridia bacterium]